jgi:hypothetical protein
MADRFRFQTRRPSRLSLLVALLALSFASMVNVAAHAQTAPSPGSNGPVPVVNAQTRAADLVESNPESSGYALTGKHGSLLTGRPFRKRGRPAVVVLS